MADRYRTNRPSAMRQPLLELKNKTNTPPVSQRQSRSIKGQTSSSLPHNESLEPNGTLTVRAQPRPVSAENKRVSQITSDDARDSKRNSAISTTSTSSGVRRKTWIGHWQLGKTIGRGGCSRVRVVRHRYRDQYGAVKIITRSTAEQTRAQSLANLIESIRASPGLATSGYKPIPYGLEREIAIMKLLEHPNIVQLYDVWENRNELYLIMEYVDGGELFHYVDERQGLTEDETVYIFRQIVSALLYCHRMLICHRDLKPENILLDRRTLQVKLIDFGMAALQPKGRLLSTPCGSPHYAAPEVVSNRPYDGPLADAWSCGVILYVMLTGTTPFNYDKTNDIRILFRDITAAKYHMPKFLSRGAQDLIFRIFKADPKKRLTMDEVWDHPFMHEYDEEFDLLGPDGTKEAAVGKPPQIEEWRVKKIQDIDREILSNMRTLWHSESEQSLIQKLLDKDDLNQEKLFYAALLKHKEETLESYDETDGVSYSASDYHHSRPPFEDDAPPMPSSAPRSQSQYSIMNDEHLRPSSSFAAPPASESSYDPYRASRDPLINAQGDYLSVTVHRNGTSSTRKGSMGRNLRHPNSTRIETLKQAHRRQSNTTSSSLPRSARSRSSLQRSSMSRPSIAGHSLPSSPPVLPTMRPSDRHKRGVSFGHIRRVSTASALTAQTSTEGSMPPTPSLPAHLRKQHAKLMAGEKQGTNSSPLVHADQHIKSRKERGPTVKPETPRIRVRKPDTPGHHIRSDIRKHSAELEKACEEAFFRDSLGSNTTARTSLTDKHSPYETPPSSVAAKFSDSPDLPSLGNPPRRPLPEVPTRDTPNSYLSKTIEETRSKLAAYKANGEDNTAKFDEVMRALDNILPAAGSTPDKRIVSAPEASKHADQNGFLPIISEESSDQRSSRDGTNWHRSVTAPVARGRKPEEKTIRVVPPTSPAVVAPLNVRKRNTGSPASDDTLRKVATKRSAESLQRRARNLDSSGLASIDENSALGSPQVVRKKRSNWFGLSKKEDEVLNGDTLVDVDGKVERRKSTVISKPSHADAAAPLVSTTEQARKSRPTNEKKGFAKWFSKMGRDKGVEDSNMDELDTTMRTNGSLNSLFSSASPVPSSNDNPPQLGPARSWFARFFNIKPATHILCFELHRGKARQELVLLFKEWQRHGIRDLQYSRETNTISARVDKVNALDIKPITFRIELFIVLDNGRKVGLSIARFVQVKGAASGFRQVIDVVDGAMRSQNWLVQDEDKWRALCEVVESPY
ncbi:hypothetical protein CKM354_000286900 [Cercospora kikuchii]|uniref:non-specific serine/threonine protein kinase n=1 Tax=Cercospora kikuchii TaxID=84275 RepID=A0A9P3CDQ5_9PEZI|nr:uncharacterized protein CKM354_000286900 [Cercospora kikuchii]GIZ39487.1 hypothetical protein CKM354_000286900 [Cercospora kikuchii]